MLFYYKNFKFLFYIHILLILILIIIEFFLEILINFFYLFMQIIYLNKFKL
jgi:hypothetical protein